MAKQSPHPEKVPPLKIVNGWLASARKVASTNFNRRPPSSAVNLLVIHNISLPPEQFGGGYIEQFFSNRLDCTRHPYFKTIAGIKVSAHLLITRRGEVIQFVGFDQRAWHAGESSYEGRSNCNDFSIGIELEGSDHIPYTQEQYAQLIAVTKALLMIYPGIAQNPIVGHKQIAPERKTDPGPAFDWEKFHRLLMT